MSYFTRQNVDGSVSLVNRITGNTVMSFDSADAVTFSGSALDAMTREALAATGSTSADGASVSKQMTCVTAADGTKCVVLPAAATTTGPLYILNTVQTAVLPVFPVDGGNDNINSGAEDAQFNLGPGQGAWFVPTSATQWYVVGSAAVTATPTELNYLDIATLGTGAASKAVVLDSGDDYTWPATGILTYGVLKDSAATTVTATGAELNYLDITTLGTGAASKAVVLDAGEDYTWPATGVLTYGVLKDPAATTILATGAEINRVADVSTRIVNLTAATLSVTEADHDGKTIVIDKADGVAITLPTAAAGLKFKFIIKTTITSASTIKSATGADIMIGYALMGNDSDNTVVSWQSVAASTNDTIDLLGTSNSTGGLAGQVIEIEGLAANLWYVKIVGDAAGMEATPFANTVA